MKTELVTIGYTIPGFSDSEVQFTSDAALMDADIIVISPEGIRPSEWGWVAFSSGGGCYSADTSREYERHTSKLKKELIDFANSGGTVFVILSKEEMYTLSSGTSSPRKDQKVHHTYMRTNYDFLPVDLGSKTSSSGSRIHFSGNEIFREFFDLFKQNLRYKLYFEGRPAGVTVFTGKLKDKILGSHVKCGDGNFVLLPYIDYDFEAFTVENQDDDEGRLRWTKEAVSFGQNLVGALKRIDKRLNSDEGSESPPPWAANKEFQTHSEQMSNVKLLGLLKKKKDIENDIRSAKSELMKEQRLKALLFAQGKLLEQGVAMALHALGYTAEGYDDGTLELDHVIVSPEGARYIGESEGKDNKDINITKFRQLSESMNADFARDDVEEKAFGLLFGNPQRLVDPKDRTLDFTEKCKKGAERDKIGLINTVDLFFAAKHAMETNDIKYKRECRNAIHEGLGSIITFPKSV